MKKEMPRTSLRSCRVLLGLSLRQVYQEVFIYPSRLSRLERGLVHPHEREKRALSKFYDVPVEALFPGEETK
jgi:transcriptional regulator with XRE-family HTH domain